MRWMPGILASVLVISLFACSAPSRPFVKLSAAGATDATPTPEAPAAAESLRIAVASVLSPKETFRSYQDLIAYVGRRNVRPTEFVQRSTYGEVNALVRSGNVDLAFVCTLAYVEAARDAGAELLVTPVINGRAEYYSDLVVPASSSATSIRDLRGGVFAFTDPLSNSGWLAPTYQLWRSGETPDRFFRRTIYTYSHDNSIRAVADALVDGAAVDSLVYDSTVERDPAFGRRLRIVERFGPFPAPPVVVHPGLPAERKAQLRAILIGMTDDAEGRRILADLGIDRFALVSDQAFEPIRQMRDALAQVGLFHP